MASFDVVSRIEIPEVDNAIQGALREISTRFDFKGSNCSIERVEEKLLLTADDDLKLRQVQELLRGYLSKRKVEAGAFEYLPTKHSSHALLSVASTAVDFLPASQALQLICCV